MKKLFVVLFLFSFGSFLMSEDAVARMKFKKGRSFEQCLSNCRLHHRSNPRWVRGEGQGVCFDVCNKAHQADLDEHPAPVAPAGR